MNREQNIYKKGDYYVAFLSNKPIAHLNDMFGYNDLTADDFEKTEHIGFIKSVIGDGEAFLLFTVRPVEGFRCTAGKEDILRAVDISELTEQERNRREREMFTPPTVYLNTEALEGSLEEKCTFPEWDNTIQVFHLVDFIHLARNDGSPILGYQPFLAVLYDHEV